MDSSISPSQSAARKRRSTSTVLGSAHGNTDPYRVLELYAESSSHGSAVSSVRDNAVISSQQLPVSTESSLLFTTTSADWPNRSLSSPQKNPNSPTVSFRKPLRWRPLRWLKWRVLLALATVVFLSGLLWIVRMDGVDSAGWSNDPRHTRLTATAKVVKQTNEPHGKAKKTERTTSTSTTSPATTTSVATTTTTATTENTASSSQRLTKSVVPVDAKRSAWALLVQHEDAATRLRVNCSSAKAPDTNSCPTPYVSSHLLPSWTLHQIPSNCTDCTDPGLYEVATNNTELKSQHGVFASVTGPLGRVGPMLYAMSSVTNDIDVKRELPKWGWLCHVHTSLTRLVPGNNTDAKGYRDTEDVEEKVVTTLTPYLAVMGVPSTDQPARVALRTAQRATWMTYQEVARAENDFNGALLPLYLFAAVEPYVEKAKLLRSFGSDAISPSHAAFKIATATLLHSADALTEADVYEERRVELRADWQDTETAESPCSRVLQLPVNKGFYSTPLAYLGSVLELPVIPAAVAPAEYICHASAALWKEALTHRNVVWVDMMTDRRPTTDKKLGENKKWGLPVEVGMSQKLILWLEYAYHAFPNVPYIIKGDDDSYLKVPQFLSDIRYVRTGARRREASPFGLTQLRVAAAAADENDEHADEEVADQVTTTVSSTLSADDLPECVYWGSMRSFHNVMFNAGMTFMVHRKLVQSVLGPVDELADNFDIVDLAMGEFDSRKRRAYRAARLHQEDILLGLRILAAKPHAESVCAAGKIWYIMEGFARFHDMHRGKLHNVTWSTVVAHRCTPADTYFLHYYFQHEHLLNRGGTVASDGVDVERTAERQAMKWATEQAGASPASDVGWETLPSVQWAHGEEGVPMYERYDHDKVAVYHNTYVYWQDASNHVDHGYRSIPRD